MANKIEFEGVTVLNPTDSDWCRNLYCMWAGAYGNTKCFVWANSFDDAFEHLVEWLDDVAPGLLTRIDYDAAARQLGYQSYLEADSHSPRSFNDGNLDRIRDVAEADMTIIGHTTLSNGDAIASYEWGGDKIGGETFETVKALCADNNNQANRKTS